MKDPWEKERYANGCLPGILTLGQCPPVRLIVTPPSEVMKPVRCTGPYPGALRTTTLLPCLGTIKHLLRMPWVQQYIKDKVLQIPLFIRTLTICLLVGALVKYLVTRPTVHLRNKVVPEVNRQVGVACLFFSLTVVKREGS